MAARYAPIPNPRTDPDTNPELDAAFDVSDDEDEDVDESHPLNPHRPSSPHKSSSIDGRHPNAPLTYDFNTPVADWDQPPPGSPPSPTSSALPNSIGNTNGIIPIFTPDTTPRAPTSWWRRTASVLLPTHYVSRFGLDTRSSARTQIMGGGTNNDGVFSNVSAKPTTTGTRVQEGDSIYIVPEDSNPSPPPSYAVAQADPAPPYHTSLVLLPPSSLYDTGALSGPPTQGSVIVDSLPTGTLFAFLWNTLISTTFQFVGFVLTWVMHTTHAAKFGSRAGLGITLIQWGFALRARLDDAMNAGSGTWEDGTRLTFSSTQEAEDYYNNIGLIGNNTAPATTTQSISTPEETQWTHSLLTGPMMSEWLSFFLMTIGWFLLLTSSLGFWRVKRWERSILSSNSSGSTRHTRTQSEIADEEEGRQSFFERIGLFRPPTRHQPAELDGDVGAGSNVAVVGTENSAGTAQQQAPWYSDAEHARRVREAVAREERLYEDLRTAGLL